MYRLYFILCFVSVGFFACGQSYHELDDKVNLLYKEGKYAEAIPFAIKTKDAAQKEFGDTSNKYAISLNHIGLLYRNLKNYTAAVTMYQQASATRKREFGEENPYYAMSRINLAFVYQDMGNYTAAEPLFKEASAIYKKTLGEEHPAFAMSLDNLAMLYYIKGTPDAAEPLYKQVLALRKRNPGEENPDYVTSLNNLAGIYISMHKYGVAEPLYKEALAIRKKISGEEDAGYVASIKNLAVAYKLTGKYAGAESLFKEALEIRKRIYGEEHPQYAESLSDLASLYQDMGNNTAAEPLFKQALGIDKKILGELHPGYAQDLNNLAVLYETMSNYTDAEALFKQALAIRKKTLGDRHPDYEISLSNLARLYYGMGKYAAAGPLFKEAMLIDKKVLGEEHPHYATSLDNLASLYLETGNYVLAESLYKQALAIRKKVYGEEGPNYATSLNNLAELYTVMGNYAAAEPLYKQASDTYEKGLEQEQSLYATSLNNLAALYMDMGNYVASELLFKKSSAIFKKVSGEEHPNYANSLNSLAILYKRMGNYIAAESLLKQALALIKKALGEENSHYANALNSLGGLYQDKRDYTAAEPLLKEALAIRKKLLGEEHPSYASSLNLLAILYLNMGNYTTTESLFKEALVIRKKVWGEEHPLYAESMNNLANVYLDMGNYAAAEPLFRQASGVWKKAFGDEHYDYATSLSNLALLYESKGNYTEAARYVISAAILAMNHIQKNLNDLSEAEKLKWWEISRGNFQVAPSLLFTNSNASAGFLQQACTQQLQLKGFVLNDGAKVLQEARKKGNPQLQQLLNQWQRNKAILAKQYSLPIANRMPQLDSLEKETNEQEKQINLQSSVFRASRENRQIGFAQVQQKLEQNEAAVEFIRFNYYHKRWTDSILYAAFILLPNDTSPHFVTICEEKQLVGLLENKSNTSEQFVKQLYRGVVLSNIQTDGKKGDSLYNLVWKPLLPWLKGIKRISIAPAGLLNRVAFNALPIDSTHYLIDKYQLRQYSSVRQIAEQKFPISKTDTTIQAVLYGGIDFNGVDTTSVPQNKTVSNTLPDDVKRSIRGGVWNFLPGTLQEVNSITQLFKSNKKTTQVITGTAATEESFKQLSGHSPTILHLATHGFSLPDVEQKLKDNFNNSDNQFTLADNPLLRSGIIMAGANRVWGGAEPIPGKEDGILTAYEISNLDLSNTDLVVLSACETALGDIKGTEGVFGLQRAFKLAGVQNMLLSLWQVPDKETAELMNLLYTNKLKGLSNYDAFYQAQDVMRKKYSPYYWAAFVLIE